MVREISLATYRCGHASLRCIRDICGVWNVRIRVGVFEKRRFVSCFDWMAISEECRIGQGDALSEAESEGRGAERTGKSGSGKEKTPGLRPGVSGVTCPEAGETSVRSARIRRSDGRPERCDAACRRSHRSCRCRQHRRRRYACSDRGRRSGRRRSGCSCRPADPGGHS